MVIWLHLTGGVIFPLRRNSAVSFGLPGGVPLTAGSRGTVDGWEGAAGEPGRGSTGLRVVQDIALFCFHSGTLISTQPPFICWVSPWNEIETNSLLKNERMKRKRDVVAPTPTSEDGGKKRGDADVVSLTILTTQTQQADKTLQIRVFASNCSFY